MSTEHLIVTIDQLESDGLYLLWAGNESGYSAFVRLNAPEAWWSAPKSLKAGEIVRIFGRNLARRPDHKKAFVYINDKGRGGEWLEVLYASKYEVSVRLPEELKPGEYELWVHAGTGGDYGWSDPLIINVTPRIFRTQDLIILQPGVSTKEIQNALNQGGRVRLGAGAYDIGGGLEIPDGATLEGAGEDKTFLQLAQEVGPHQTGRGAMGWDKAISRLVTGGTLDYDVYAKDSGKYALWVRYRCTDEDAKAIEQPENLLQIIVDGKEPAFCKTPPWSKSWKWAQGQAVELEEGWNRIRLRQSSRGEVLVDAMVFSRNSGWNPGSAERVNAADGRIVVQAEDVIHMQSWKGRLPGAAYAGIWIKGSHTSLSNLSLLGSNQFSVGILISDHSKIPWIRDIQLKNLVVADIDGRQMNNAGILIERAEEVVVENCDITGRNPIYLKGIRDSRISGNRLASVTRYGGNGEGYICSRTSIMHHIVIENNVFYSPYRGAGYTGRRAIWVSTGVGSVDNNVYKGNKVERTHFGGVAGTGQNVGEMYLFEWCSQTAYYGSPEGAGERSVILPKEGPYWPKEEGSEGELPLNALYDGDAFLEQFYVMVVKGTGLGQIRRVVGRKGEEIILDKPWRVKPDKNSLVIMNPLFVRNLVIDNEITDGMTGVQLWIGCVENVIANNIIKRQRRQAIFVYASLRTTATQVPRMWNAGIGPSYYNFIEGNDTDECATGVLFNASQGLFSHGLMKGIPYTPVPGKMDWPLMLGNVVRQNSAVASRSSGVDMQGSRSKDLTGQPVPITIGNIVEFNFLRDSWRSGIRLGNLTDISVVRRNHIYFWSKEEDKDLPYGIDVRGAENVVISDNNVENWHGGELRTPNRVMKD